MAVRMEGVGIESAEMVYEREGFAFTGPKLKCPLR